MTQSARTITTRRAFLALAAAGGACVLGGCGDEKNVSLDDPTSLKNVNSIRIGTDCDSPPYEWMIDTEIEESLPVDNKAGYYATGFDVLLMRDLGEYYDVKVVLVNLDHPQLLEYLSEGLVDVVVSAYGATNERSEYAEFSEGYNPYRLAVVARADSPYASATSIAELAGAVVSVKDATIVADLADEIPNVTVQEPHLTMSETYGAVVDGSADIVIVDRTAWDMRAASWPSLTMLDIAEEDLPVPGDGYMHVAVRKDETVMLDEVNAFLADLGEDGIAKLWDETAELEQHYELSGEDAYLEQHQADASDASESSE
jgi:ABC-type amino acid transport substrate-binding protein